MSIALRLASNQASLKSASDQINYLCNSTEAVDIVRDVNFRQENVESADLLNLTLFQLHAQLQEVEDASERLNFLWLIKALIQEINVSFDPVGGSETYVCDQDELDAIFQNLKKLRVRIDGMDNKDLKIIFALKTCYNDLADKLFQKLKRMFLEFFPVSTDRLLYVINTEIQANGSPATLERFVRLASDIESYFSRSDIADEFSKLKVAWDKEILDKLVKKPNYYLETEEDLQSIRLIASETSHSRKSLSSLYFKSLRSFILFINVLDNQTFKNYYSTKISNDLVLTVSENIRMFKGNKGHLTDELMEILELLAKTDWSVPIRNVFSSLEKVDEGLQSIYNGWVTDKYINEVREIFNSEDFESHFANLKDVVQETKAIEKEQVEDDWGGWESDEEQKPEDGDFDNWSTDEKQDNDEGDDWDDWDDQWDDDAEESTSKVTKSVKPVKEGKPSQSLATKELNATFKYSPIPFKLSILIAKFVKEANNGDCQDILETIAALSSISYPDLSKLFLLFNDLKKVKTSSEYLSQAADQEWNHTQQVFLDKITLIMTKIDYEIDDLSSEEDLHTISNSLDQFQNFIDHLFSQDLENTNSEMFKILIIELMNFANNLILEEIMTSREISESQSEKFTQVLNGLQSIEEQILLRIGLDFTTLASYNKLTQAVILLNNHLKEIMGYFYQGELHAFSTDELIQVIKSVFVPSDLRENCIGDIIEIRNS